MADGRRPHGPPEPDPTRARSRLSTSARTRPAPRNLALQAGSRTPRGRLDAVDAPWYVTYAACTVRPMLAPPRASGGPWPPSVSAPAKQRPSIHKGGCQAMAEQFAVTAIPGAETGEIPPSPVDRDEKTAFIYSLVDPLWDIDVLPLTYTNSRWSAFFYRADAKALRRVCPDVLEIEDDVVEFWYVDHNNTMLGPYGEMGVTVACSHKAATGRPTTPGTTPTCTSRRTPPSTPAGCSASQEGSLHPRARARRRARRRLRRLRHQGLPVRFLLVPDDPERVRDPLGRPASTTTRTSRRSRSSTATPSTAG